MTSRANSDLLLVGSLPAESTEAAFRAGAELFGDMVFALPDGETGPRAAWVGYEREQLCRPNPDVVVVQETESPTGIPRHAYETPIFSLRPGAPRATIPRCSDFGDSAYERPRGRRIATVLRRTLPGRDATVNRSLALRWARPAKETWNTLGCVTAGAGTSTFHENCVPPVFE